MVRVITSGLLVVVVFVVSIHFNKIQEYCLSAVAGRCAVTAWFSGLICTWQLHAASPLRSATYISKHAGANQIVTCLLCHCSGPARCCSQPASWLIGLLPAVALTDLRSRQQKSGPICTHFWKNVIIFVTTTPIDIKTSTCPAYGQRLCAKFGHRTTRRLGGARPQTK